ncbi:MAG: 30S ribosomal protein S6 [Candidatus Pacebacteria bacterium]|nr:30S ribosomal protein S6 [Candidatus Paceibacterota bacterium]
MKQKLYELTYLLSADFSEEQAVEFVQNLQANLPESKIMKSEAPKKIGLSYPIKKQDTAFLASVIFESTPETAEAIKKNLEKEGKILRFLIVSKKSIQETPVFTPRESRPETASEPEQVIPEQAAVPNAIQTKPAAPDSEETKPVKKTTRKKKTDSEETKSDLKQIEEDLNKILDQ